MIKAHCDDPSPKTSAPGLCACLHHTQELTIAKDVTPRPRSPTSEGACLLRPHQADLSVGSSVGPQLRTTPTDETNTSRGLLSQRRFQILEDSHPTAHTPPGQDNRKLLLGMLDFVPLYLFPGLISMFPSAAAKYKRD